MRSPSQCQRVRGIRCRDCGTPFPDLPEYKQHRDERGECPEAASGGDRP